MDCVPVVLVICLPTEKAMRVRRHYRTAWADLCPLHPWGACALHVACLPA